MTSPPSSTIGFGAGGDPSGRLRSRIPGGSGSGAELPRAVRGPGTLPPLFAVKNAVTSAATSSANILVVDDNPDALAIMNGMMERMGTVRVTAFVSPSRALAALAVEPHRFDLAVLDYHMPEMFGGELAERIHAINPQLPVVCITAFLPEPMPTPVFAGILRKPIKIYELHDFIKRHLGWG